MHLCKEVAKFDGSLKLEDYVSQSQETIRAMYILPLDKYKKIWIAVHDKLSKIAACKTSSG